MIPSLKYILRALTPHYTEGEARAIAHIVLESRFGLTPIDICMERDNITSLEKRRELENIVNRLVQKEPVQYILGEARFHGHIFHVASSVLIPRPETEELVDWIIKDTPSTSPEILDIGTGSGCIAITLAKEIPNAHVTALDISTQALDIAKGNARELQANVTFLQKDILAPDISTELKQKWDIIVSNPPYICEQEQSEMEANVLHYEPRIALFVPNKDPLLFYRAIGQYAIQNLKPEGNLYVEINRVYGAATARLFHDIGFYDVTIRKDLFGNERMIRARI